MIYVVNPEVSPSANCLPRHVYITIPAGYDVSHKNAVNRITKIVGNMPIHIKKYVTIFIKGATDSGEFKYGN